jgi:hypothetical protein
MSNLNCVIKITKNFPASKFGEKKMAHLKEILYWLLMSIHRVIHRHAHQRRVIPRAPKIN